MFFIELERPLSGKADVQILVFDKSLRNGQYAVNLRKKITPLNKKRIRTTHSARRYAKNLGVRREL